MSSQFVDNNNCTLCCGTKLLFIVYKLGTSFYTEVSCITEQKVATYLHKKRPIYYTKSGRFIALKVVTCLHQKGPLSGTTRGRFIGQKVAICLHKDSQFIALKAAAF